MLWKPETDLKKKKKCWICIFQTDTDVLFSNTFLPKAGMFNLPIFCSEFKGKDVPEVQINFSNQKKRTCIPIDLQ